MNGQQLLTQLQSYISNGVLTLSTNNNLNSSSINTLLGNFFANTLTVIIGGDLEVDATHVSFTNCSFNAHEFWLYRSQATLQTQLTFEIVAPDDRIELQVQLTLPDSYTFGDSFETVKNLVHNPLNDLKITKTKLLFNSKNSSNTFGVIADVVKNDGLIKPIGWLFEDDIALSGTIQIIRADDNKVYPEMRLKTATSKSPPLMNFEMDVLLQAQSKLVTISSSGDLLNQQVQLIANITIVADFITSKFRLPVLIDVRSGSNSSYHVMLDLLRPSPSISQLSDISDLTGQVNPSESLSADTPIGNLSFQSVEFRLDAANRSITDFTIGIHLGTNWTIKQKVLELEGLTMVIIIPNFAQPTDFGVMVMANLLIGNARANAYISYPDKIIGTQTTTLININDFLSTFAENTKLPGTGDLTIYEFNLTANVANQTYSLNCNAAGNWSVIPNFVLDEIEFAIDYGGTLVLVFGCIFTIAKAELYLQAAKGLDTWTLSGGTYKKQQISLTDLVTDLLSIFHIALPNDLPQFYLLDLELTNYETKTGNFTFQANAAYINDDDSILRKIEGRCVINREQDTNQQPIWSGNITGLIKIGENQFNVSYDFKKSQTITASWQAEGGKSLSIVDLCRALLDTELPDIPADLDLGLNRASFIYDLTNKEVVLEANSVNYGKAIFIGLKNQQQQWEFLFGFVVSESINLSNLPLVGREFTPEPTVKVTDLQLVIVSHDFSADEVGTFNKLIPDNITKLPQQAIENKAPETPAIKKGFNVSAKLQFGNTTEILALPVSSGNRTETGAEPSALTPANPSTSTSTADNATWFKLQKNFGPIHFERIGVQYKDAAVWFLLDAALSASGLTLALEGLSVGSPLSKFEPKFNLHGIGIDYQSSGTVTIGGAFLKQGDEYSGTAFIKTADLTLSAVGSYYAHTPPHDDPSLFIYALLNKPIGGPAFFFVTGLAAAFGYNRALTLPTIDQVATFPLIQAAISSTGSPTDLSGMLRNLHTYIKPATGEVFLAVGVKFTSFKLIDSFALLIATFGDPFELHILGLSTLITPTPEAGKTVTPLAEVQMALKATFIPEQGFLAVNAQLTPSSYIFSKACHLVGGFAYYSWFSGDHAGDFVITLGGYHPHFNVPTHYPQVPRLGFNWQVDEHLTIKGDAYYALTPAALMAGGHLQARWESGPLSAWFNAGADFLIAWKPYHYEASIYVDMGVSYTFEVPLLVTTIRQTISFDIGADLEIWGPDFSGIAHIHLWIISFDVSFGSSSSQQPQAIDWNTFKASFLPADDQICSIVVKDGLVKEIKSEHPTTEEVQHLGVINPKHFSLITNSIIPSNQAKHATEENHFIPFGIAPMDLRADSGFTSTHTITITRTGAGSVEGEFKFTPILKNMPSGLWGNTFHPDLNAPQTINNLLSGFEITPGTPPEPGQTQKISSDLLQDALSTLNDAYHFKKLSSFAAEPLENTPRIDKIKQTLSDCPTRTLLLQALGFSADEIDLHSAIADDLLVPPQIGTLTPLAA